MKYAGGACLVNGLGGMCKLSEDLNIIEVLMLDYITCFLLQEN